MIYWLRPAKHSTPSDKSRSTSRASVAQGNSSARKPVRSRSWHPKSPNAENDTANARDAARKLGLALQVLSASFEKDLEAAFAEAKDNKAAGLSINLDPFFGTVRNKIYTLAALYRIPTIYFYAYYAREGGLIAYGPDLADSYRQAGIYAAKIVQGAKVGDLPVMQPTKFELAINPQNGQGARSQRSGAVACNGR